MYQSGVSHVPSQVYPGRSSVAQAGPGRPQCSRGWPRLALVYCTQTGPRVLYQAGPSTHTPPDTYPPYHPGIHPYTLGTHPVAKHAEGTSRPGTARHHRQPRVENVHQAQFVKMRILTIDVQTGIVSGGQQWPGTDVLTTSQTAKNIRCLIVRNAKGILAI